jgi:hypothetical protein
MDIQKVNATLIAAIEHFQEGELERLWEFMVPSPHEMHRTTGMRLPKGQFVVPTPAQVKARSQTSSKPKVVSTQAVDIDQKKIAAGAAKTPEQINRIFDKLKPRQTVWLLFDSGIARGREYIQFTVGRRSRSKKYNRTRITMLHKGQKKPAPTGMQPNLHKQGDRNAGFALGDLATVLRGIYVQ